MWRALQWEKKRGQINLKLTCPLWRRLRDSNPRYPCRYTHFPGVLLQPLGQVSIYFLFPSSTLSPDLIGTPSTTRTSLHLFSVSVFHTFSRFDRDSFNHSDKSPFIFCFRLPHFLPMLIGTPSTTRTSLHLFFCCCLSHFLPMLIGTPSTTRTSLHLFFCCRLSHFLPI
jgi:hypothetical protein